MEKQLFIFDANIIIDFLKADKLILEILSRQFHIIIPNVVFDEINSLTIDMAESFGIQILEVDLEILISATKISDNSKLSVQDASSLLIAKKENFTCATNDRALYNACKEENIKVFWGLELILDLYYNSVISKEQAINIGDKLRNINYKITDNIINEFKNRL
jgi:predicted nucleic acid-binding protein